MSGADPRLSPPVVGVLAVQGAFAEHVHALRRVGADARLVRTAEGLSDLAALVLPGGESTTLGLVAGRSGLLDELRAVVRERRYPVLGTCAGMIMLAARTTTGAQPLVGGMDIVVRRNAFGAQSASFEAPIDVRGICAGGPIPGVFIRAPWIEQSGPEVEVLARYDGRGVAARQGDLLATSFHPELTDDLTLHRWFVERARERRGVGSDVNEGGSRVGAQ